MDELLSKQLVQLNRVGFLINKSSYVPCFHQVRGQRGQSQCSIVLENIRNKEVVSSFPCIPKKGGSSGCCKPADREMGDCLCWKEKLKEVLGTAFIISIAWKSNVEENKPLENQRSPYFSWYLTLCSKGSCLMCFQCLQGWVWSWFHHSVHPIPVILRYRQRPRMWCGVRGDWNNVLALGGGHWRARTRPETKRGQGISKS